MNKKTLTKREQDVIDVFWDADEALSASGVVALNSQLSKNTVQAVIKKLLKYQLLKIEDVGYSGTVLTRLYSPTISREEWLASNLSDQSLKLIASQFIEKSDNTEVLDQMSRLIESRKQKLDER